jgi:octaprenyl-diphosphate synthase
MSVVLSNPDVLKDQIRAIVGDDLAHVNTLLAQQFRNPSMFVQDVAQHVIRFQGKQVRPVLTLLSARLFDGFERGRPMTHRLAAVVEMIHAATLVHDDVIDDSELRRHVATVHRRWNTQTSILFGDYLLSRAFHLAATTGDAEACRLIGLATDRTCEGELNQIAARLEQSSSERDYFRIIGGKTGQLFAVSCQLGARSAGADCASQNRLRLFGHRVGMAFQIADDVLDLTESAEQTGKDADNDLSNHRRTLPILRALRFASASDSRRLVTLISSPGADAASQLRDEPAIRRGIASAQATAREFVRRAVGSLQPLQLSRARSVLEAIAHFATERTT